MDNGWASPVSRADTSWKRSNFTHASKNAGESLSAERLDGMLPTRPGWPPPPPRDPSPPAGPEKSRNTEGPCR